MGAGEAAPLAFSIAYAAPEVIEAYEQNDRLIVADPAIDIWALGVIAFELLTNVPSFAPGTNKQTALDIIAGRGQFPWEKPGNQELLSRLRRLKGTILSCLDRNASKRPTAASLVKSWNCFFDSNTSVPNAQSRFNTFDSTAPASSNQQSAPPGVRQCSST
jgi:serine/threonine protein kinase